MKWQRIDSGLYTAHVGNYYLDVRATPEFEGHWKWTINNRFNPDMQRTGHADTKEMAMEICEQWVE